MKTEKDSLRKPDRLRTQVAELKSMTKVIAKYAVKEKDEWISQTAHERVPRLGALAVEGKQPVIKGMPAIADADAQAIVQTIMAMRGADENT